MRVKVDKTEMRTPAELKEHYEVERALANRLRSSSREQRLTLYGAVYDELFTRVRTHPLLTRKGDPRATAAAIRSYVRILTPFLRRDSTFLEVGSGDCALSCALAPLTAKVYAVDVSEEITDGVELPGNVEVRISDGVSIPVPDQSVDVAFSNALMEHLHPEDAWEQLQNVCRSLRPGGVYICITPNRLYGPHDISKYFDDRATGFHLKEYTTRELRSFFKKAGFSRVTVLVGGRGHYVESPCLPVELLEVVLGLLPVRGRRTLAEKTFLTGALGIRIVGRK
jgi:SAM-dependent methyltransferase